MSKRNNIFDWETRRHTYEFSTMVYRFVDVIFIIVGRSFLSCPHFEVQTASSLRGFVQSLDLQSYQERDFRSLHKSAIFRKDYVQLKKAMIYFSLSVSLPHPHLRSSITSPRRPSVLSSRTRPVFLVLSDLPPPLPLTRAVLMFQQSVSFQPFR